MIATDPIAYGRSTGGQTYLDEIRKVTDKPVKYVIYSHHHFDHIAGGKAFKDAGATFVAHRRAKERLEQLRDPHTVLPDEGVSAQDQLTLLQAASTEMKKLAQDGKRWAVAEKKFKLSGYETWPGYAENLEFIARRYCGLWGRGT